MRWTLVSTPNVLDRLSCAIIQRLNGWICHDSSENNASVQSFGVVQPKGRCFCDIRVTPACSGVMVTRPAIRSSVYRPPPVRAGQPGRSVSLWPIPCSILRFFLVCPISCHCWTNSSRLESLLGWQSVGHSHCEANNLRHLERAGTCLLGCTSTENPVLLG